jgi:uncharacterized Zn-binding protein involved in type VI secretion
MPEVARGDGEDKVRSKTGSGTNCANQLITATDECSQDVFVNNIGVVREGDKVAEHPALGCDPDKSVLTTFSTTVFINNKGAGRKGDKYTSDNTIIEGSPNTFMGPDIVEESLVEE